MAWDERSPLRRYIRQQRVVDAEMRRVLLRAANDSKRLLATLDPSSVRAAQLRLQQLQLRMWAQVGNIIETGITSNVGVVTDLSVIFTDDLLSRLGVRANSEFRQMMAAQARNTINNYLARQNLGLTLSERVYRNGQVASGRIDRLVENGLLRGASAREIARDVAGLINPNTPGGVSYAAMRLGRTELNNSFHQAASEQYASNPFVDKVQWTLSASHPKSDECDDLVGVYRPDEVPPKPHPHCFCYITPQVIPLAQLQRRFNRGEFNEWADAQSA